MSMHHFPSVLSALVWLNPLHCTSEGTEFRSGAAGEQAISVTSSPSSPSDTTPSVSTALPVAFLVGQLLARCPASPQASRWGHAPIQIHQVWGCGPRRCPYHRRAREDEAHGRARHRSADLARSQQLPGGRALLQRPLSHPQRTGGEGPDLPWSCDQAAWGSCRAAPCTQAAYPAGHWMPTRQT